MAINRERKREILYKNTKFIVFSIWEYSNVPYCEKFLKYNF